MVPEGHHAGRIGVERNKEPKQENRKQSAIFIILTVVTAVCGHVLNCSCAQGGDGAF